MAEASDTFHRSCPDCGGTLVAVHMMARGNSGLSLGSSDALVRYYVSAESERVQTGDSVMPAGLVRAMLCGQCHRMFFYGVPNLLEAPKRFDATSSISARLDDEPLQLARDSNDNVRFLRIEQEGPVTIVRIVTERMNFMDDVVHRSIGKEFTEVVEQCRPRTILDLRELLPAYHSSAFVTNLIKFKRRWLEMHDIPEGRRDDSDAAGSRPAQPSVRQLSFPVFPNRDAALNSLVGLADGRAEMALCGVSQALLDVLRVTRMLRKSEHS